MSIRPIRPHRRATSAETLESRVLLATQTFGVSDSMNIQEDFNPPTPPVQHYPSAIIVSGVTGPVSELRVALNGVYHTRPQDLDVLLVSPTGKSVLVMSDAGDTVPISEDTPVDLAFADNATRSLPDNAGLTPGLYKPTNYDNEEFWRENELINAPTDTTLAGVAADDPHGMWRLFLTDDTIGDTGGILFGWSLTFVTGGTGPAAPSTPDMLPASDRGVSSTDNITNVSVPFFRGTATAGTQVRLFVDGIPTNATGAITNGNYQVQAGGITDGTHVISVRAIDATGTEGPSSGELTVTIDTLPPNAPSIPDLTPESDTGASNTDNDTNDTTPTFTGTVVGANTVTLIANDQVVGTATVVNGTYTVTPTNPLAVGTYEFAALGSDLAGNNSGVDLPGLTVIIRPGGTVTPTITAAYVRGSAWTASFKNYLAAKGLGDATLGYNLAGVRNLPWINLDQVVLRYNGNLTAAPTSVTLQGQRSSYPVTATLADPQTVVLNVRALGDPGTGNSDGDRLRLTVPNAAAGGAAYVLNFNVLPGDVDNSGVVLAADFSEVKKRFFKDTTDATSGDSSYSPYHDVDGSGNILAFDFSEVKKRFFDSLPPAAAAATAANPFASGRIADDVLA
jgi:subtilisin-like proprotein convertase family protein